MKTRITEARSIVTKSSIPGIDHVINPYTGCYHGCIYCYAEFMKRFTDHKGEKWGSFVDIKRFDKSRIRPSKYDGKKILFSSVTDPYQPVERKYRNSRILLKTLIGTTAEITILTKSSLVQRDIDLFKQFNNISVGISLSTLDHDLAKQLEPKASLPSARLKALEQVHDEGVFTFLFISPLFPGITEFENIITASKSFVDNYMFENINIRPNNRQRILSFIQNNRIAREY
ncbi:MAG: radical SAM protein [Candidatus Hodarchaeales archaeon]